MYCSLNIARMTLNYFSTTFYDEIHDFSCFIKNHENKYVDLKKKSENTSQKGLFVYHLIKGITQHICIIIILQNMLYKTIRN